MTSSFILTDQASTFVLFAPRTQLKTTRFPHHHPINFPYRETPSPGVSVEKKVFLADFAFSPEWALHSAPFGCYEESQHSSPTAERGRLKHHRGTLIRFIYYLVTRVMFFPFPTRRGVTPTKVPRTFREPSVGFPPAFGGPSEEAAGPPVRSQQSVGWVGGKRIQSQSQSQSQKLIINDILIHSH